MIPGAAVERDVVIVACAIGAGVHASLAPDHGAAFAVASALLAVAALALTRSPSPRPVLAAAAVLLVAAGLSVVHDGLFTGSVELLGLVAAARLLRRRGAPRLALRPIPVGLTALIACFSAFAALALSGGHGGHDPAGGHAERMHAGA